MIQNPCPFWPDKLHILLYTALLAEDVLDITETNSEMVEVKNKTKNNFGVNSLTLGELKELKQLSLRQRALEASRQKWDILMKYEGQTPDQMRLRAASDMPC